MKNYEEILKNLINEDTADMIIQFLTDYLSSLEAS